jgi:hypothetical protein
MVEKHAGSLARDGAARPTDGFDMMRVRTERHERGRGSRRGARVDGEMGIVPAPIYRATDSRRLVAEECARGAANREQGGLTLLPKQRWSEAHLRDVLENGSRTMRTVLLYLADRPGGRVNGRLLAEIAHGPGASVQQLGGPLGAFTRTALRRYGRADRPFETLRDGGGLVWGYAMDPDTAERVRRLAGS